MKLTIITINFNNVAGLQKTMQSVFDQTSTDFEYIVVDGGSSDGSYELICQYANKPINIPFRWISEKDNGIYHAMNKGIKLAKGEYCQFLNSGDYLMNESVIKKMLLALANQKNIPNILYGNMIKQLPQRLIRDKGFAGRKPTMLDFYIGTLNHSSAYIKLNLFETFGLYDEMLQIVSDWKWYLNVIIFNEIIPIYVNIDVTVFDMNGISNINSTLDKMERKKVLESLLPPNILVDYEKYAFQIESINKINRYWSTRTFFWLTDRILFKFLKWFTRA